MRSLAPIARLALRGTMHALLAERRSPAHHRPDKNHIRGSVAMSGFSRRDFLSLTGSAAVAAASGHANAAMGPNDKFDLVIKGGDVLDPSQSLRGKRDIGIRWGVIEAVENEIPAARAAKTIDASGKLVTPGLIDLHSHVYPYGSAIGIPADELVQFAGHHHGGVGGRCRRQQPRRAAPLHRGAIAGADLRLRPHRQQRPVRLPGRRALQHRLCAGGSLRDGAGRKSGFPARRQGADVGERHRQAWRSSR